MTSLDRALLTLSIETRNAQPRTDDLAVNAALSMQRRAMSMLGLNASAEDWRTVLDRLAEVENHLYPHLYAVA
jgi:hypothetical protein